MQRQTAADGRAVASPVKIVEARAGREIRAGREKSEPGVARMLHETAADPITMVQSGEEQQPGVFHRAAGQHHATGADAEFPPGWGKGPHGQHLATGGVQLERAHGGMVQELNLARSPERA